MAGSSLTTEYKDQLSSLNPSLPQVIEHFVRTEILTRTEASKVLSTSNQFTRLCSQLAAKGVEKKDEVLSEIGAFREGQKEREQGKYAGRQLDKVSAHMYVVWDPS